MIDLIHLQENRLHNIVTNELEMGVPKMMDHIVFPASEEIVNHNHIVPSGDELVDEVTPHEASPAGHHDPQPPVPEPHRDPPNLAGPEIVPGMRRDPVAHGGRTRREGSGYGGVGLGRAYAGEGRLEDEECGANQDTHEDEQQPLLPEEVVDGSGEGSGVLEGFGRVRGRWGRWDLFVPSVIHA